MMVLKTPAELAIMDRANRLVHETLQRVVTAALPGVSTLELDRLAEAYIRSQGGTPAFKGYRGYPACLCTSVNNVIVHGIPSAKQKLVEGDILSIDCGAVVDGFVGDAAVTIPIGRVSGEAERLMRITRECLEKAVSVVKASNRLGLVGYTVQQHAEAAGYSVVREMCGHGVGRAMHEDPQVPNYGAPGRGPEMRPGLVLAIEPMVNQGKPGLIIDDDGWTALTEDGKLSAHFEFSVAVTDNGPWVLGLGGM